MYLIELSQRHKFKEPICDLHKNSSRQNLLKDSQAVNYQISLAAKGRMLNYTPL